MATIYVALYVAVVCRHHDKALTPTAPLPVPGTAAGLLTNPLPAARQATSASSYEQSKAQMALWVVMASPLLSSVDLRTIGPEYRAILQNRGAIAISQDSLGIQGKRIFKVGAAAAGGERVGWREEWVVVSVFEYWEEG